MAVRLKDIAQDLNISVVTVSKVLRKHPDIGPETRQKVLQRIKELNYRPNLAARALVTGRTRSDWLCLTWSTRSSGRWRRLSRVSCESLRHLPEERVDQVRHNQSDRVRPVTSARAARLGR